MTKEEFEKLTPDQQRVAVAQDVLAQLAADKLCALRGAWVTMKPGFKAPIEQPQTFADALDKRACESCVIGSVFLSIARILQLKTRGVMNFMGDINTRDMLQLMTPYFEPVQLAMMEVAFEGSSITYDHGDGYGALDAEPIKMSQEQYEAARAFGGWHVFFDEDADDEMEDTDLNEFAVLAKIMRNVVDNGGTFDPTKTGEVVA